LPFEIDLAAGYTDHGHVDDAVKRSRTARGFDVD
jgi:hypothetical protein